MSHPGTTHTLHYYIVTVASETEDQADQVMAERLNHDEDYGFAYTVDFETAYVGPAPTMTTDKPMWALVTHQGTAMPETALCDEHYTEEWRLQGAQQATADWSHGPYFVVTGNTELTCFVCGATT